MRRGVLVTEHWEPHVGGIERYLRHIVAALDMNVTVVAPRLQAALSVEGALVVRRRFFHALARPRWLYFFIWLWRYVRREEFEFVLCGKALFEGLVALYLKRFTGIPYIVFTYATEIETWAQRDRTRRKLTKVLGAADAVIYINDETRERLTGLGVIETQLHCIYPGVEERFFVSIAAPEREAVLRKYTISSPYVLCVSRLISRKGIDTLIEAFGALDQTTFGNYQLVIVGEGPEREALEQLAKQLFIEKTVHFTGHVTDADLPALYQGADIFALTPRAEPHDLEGFGIVYLEAAASGLPVLATRTGGVSGAVVDGSTGCLVSPDSTGEVTEALTSLLTDRAQAERFGVAGKERAHKDFSWKSRGKLLATVIDSVLEKIV